MKSNTKFFLVLALVLVITLAAANWEKLQAAVTKATGNKAADANTNTGTTTTPSTSTGGTAASNGAVITATGLQYNLLLKKGSKNAEVKQLQAVLNLVNSTRKEVTTAKGGYTLGTDGDFGNDTEKFLLHYTGLNQITLQQANAEYQRQFGVQVVAKGSQAAKAPFLSDAWWKSLLA